MAELYRRSDACVCVCMATRAGPLVEPSPLSPLQQCILSFKLDGHTTSRKDLFESRETLLDGTLIITMPVLSYPTPFPTYYSPAQVNDSSIFVYHPSARHIDFEGFSALVPFTYTPRKKANEVKS